MRLTASAEVATVLCSIPVFSDTVESEGRQMKQFGIQYIEEKIKKIPLLKKDFSLRSQSLGEENKPR